MTDVQPDAPSLATLRRVLNEARLRRRTMTYLEVAETLELAGPGRIHRVTALLEALLAEDAGSGRTPLAALVVSRARQGLPAPGFFEAACRHGLGRAEDPAAFHARLLRELFEGQVSDSP